MMLNSQHLFLKRMFTDKPSDLDVWEVLHRAPEALIKPLILRKSVSISWIKYDSVFTFA